MRAPSPRSASLSRGRGCPCGVQRGGVELDHLEVGDRHAGAQGGGDAVAGRLGRVGGHREHLAGPAGRHQHGSSPHLDGAVVAVEHPDPDAAAALHEEVDHEAALVARHRRPADGLDERPLDLDAGGRAAGVHHPGQLVAAFAGQLELTGVVPVEPGAELDQVAHPVGSLVDQDPHRVSVAQPAARGEGVGEVQVGRVGRPAERGGDAALGPPGGGPVQRALGEHGDPEPVTLGGADRCREPGDAGPEHEQVRGDLGGCGAHDGTSLAGAGGAPQRG